MNKMKSSHIEIHPCENGWIVTAYDPMRIWAFESVSHVANFVKEFFSQQEESSDEG
jgi:hypothetical protein